MHRVWIHLSMRATAAALACLMFSHTSVGNEIRETALPLTVQKPNILTIDYDTPRSWQEALNRSDFVAVIKVKGRVDNPQLAAVVPYPRTRFEAEVIEIVAGSRAAPVGSAVALIRNGGISHNAGRASVFEETGFPLWSVGRTILVFLQWIEPYQAYVLVGGPDGAFELDPTTQRVRTPARGGFASRQNGRALAELLKEIRFAAR